MHKLIVAFKCQLKRYAQGLQNNRKQFKLIPMSMLGFTHLIRGRLIGYSQILTKTAARTNTQLGTSHPDLTVNTYPQVCIQAV